MVNECSEWWSVECLTDAMNDSQLEWLTNTMDGWSLRKDSTVKDDWLKWLTNTMEFNQLEFLTNTVKEGWLELLKKYNEGWSVRKVYKYSKTKW